MVGLTTRISKVQKEAKNLLRNTNHTGCTTTADTLQIPLTPSSQTTVHVRKSTCDKHGITCWINKPDREIPAPLGYFNSIISSDKGGVGSLCLASSRCNERITENTECERKC